MPYGIMKPIDLLRLTKLDAPERNIRDLRGLEYALNLRFLSLRNNEITDIGPLIENSSLGGMAEGVRIDLTGNRLDTADGSRTRADIATLLGRGVVIQYDR